MNRSVAAGTGTKNMELHLHQIRVSKKTLLEVENENKFGAESFLRKATLWVHRGEFELR